MDMPMPHSGTLHHLLFPKSKILSMDMSTHQKCGAVELNWDNFLDLDSGTKYCLVDTSALLPLFCGDVDVLRDAKRRFGGATLVLLRPIIHETLHKYREWENDREKGGLDGFALRLSGRLRQSRMPFRLSEFDDQMSASLDEMICSETHSGLSNVDYSLLCAAMERPDMDVMTGDKSLIGSICNENHQARDKARSVLYNHNKRRGDTAGFIRRKIAKNVTPDVVVGWQYRATRTEFLIGGEVAVSIQHPPGGKWSADPSGQACGKRAGAGLSRKEVLRFFSEWKPEQGGRGPPQKKDLYRRNRDDISGWADGVRGRSSRKRRR